MTLASRLQRTSRRTTVPVVAGAAASAAYVCSNVASSWNFMLSAPTSSPDAAVSHLRGQSPTVRAAALTTAASGAAAGSAMSSCGLVCPGVASVVAAACGYRQTRRRQQQQRASSVARLAGGGDIEDVVPFEVRGFSLAQLFLAVGVFMILYTFVDYYITVSNGGGNGVGSLFLVYAIPVFLLGAALTYAELQPVEVETAADAEGLLEKVGTGTLKKIKSDVTRHRYGDDAHLDSSLKVLGLYVKGSYPELFKILETKAPSGELEFTMLFKSKTIPYNTWADPMKIKAFDRFFGPGVWASVYKYSKEEKIAALKLTTGKRPTDEEAAVEAALAAALKKQQEEEEEEMKALARP